MSFWRISPAEERWLELAARFRQQSKTPFFLERTGGWRDARLLSRCAFFILGLVVALAAWAISYLLHLGNGTAQTGIVLVAAAEWLVLSRRFVFSGIEEALEIAGLVMLAFGLWELLGSWSESFAALLAAVACAVAGFRLLNPLFTLSAAACLSVALEMAIDRPGIDPRHASLWAGLFCFAVAWLALGLGAMRLERPSLDRMLSWLMVAMPLAGYLWMAAAERFTPPSYLADLSFPAWLTPLLPLAFASAALVIGLQRRAHAPLLACMIAIACCAFELRRTFGWPLEARLVFWGSVVLIAAMALDRALRKPRGGITSEKFSDASGTLDLLELAGAAAIGPRAQDSPGPASPTGEGSFGGGGASGRY